MVKSYFVSVLAAAAFFQSVDGYWRMPCGTIAHGRLDPIVAPGLISQHAHKLSGPSNLGLGSTYDTITNASCTSCVVQADKSAYWTPMLYYRHADGSFEEVSAAEMVIYYLGRGENRTNIMPFPPGFRMTSGNPYARSYDSSTYTYGGLQGVVYQGGTCNGNGTCTGGNFVAPAAPGVKGPRFTGRPLSDRTSFNCLDVSGPLKETPNTARTNCSNGLRAQIHFPSCWDGVNLYKTGNSHVAHMSQIDNGVCPPNYPVQFVHLFFEVLYATNNIKHQDGQFVFAQGDPTGYGFHGDFLNGWDPKVQAAALTECANTDFGGDIHSCRSLLPSIDDQAGFNCPERPQLIIEPTRGKIVKLPGCIKVTPGPDAAQSPNATCPAGTVQPALNASATASPTGPTFRPVVGTTYNSWTYLGCADDSSHTFASANYASDNMTNANCQSCCASKGFVYAATEFSRECYCGSAVPSTTPLNQSCQSMICSGSSLEFCGGPSRLSLWNSTSKTAIASTFKPGAVLSNTYVYLGCASEVGGRALDVASYASSTNMSNTACAGFCASNGLPLFGTEYGTECYCGKTLASGSSLGRTGCNMACSGTEAGSSPFAAYASTCGGNSRLTVFNNTAVQAASNPRTVGAYVFAGCFAEGTGGRALTSDGYVNAKNMTVENCVAYCAGKRYRWAGVEYAQECYCGTAIGNGGRVAADASTCSMVCRGNPHEICGGPSRLSVYTAQ